MNAERKKPSTQLGVAPEASPRTDHSSGTAGSKGAAPSAWTGLSWKSLLGLDDPPPRKAAVEVSNNSRPSETRRASKQQLSTSAGFYSTKPKAEEATFSVSPARSLSPPVTIPKPPALPADLLGSALGAAVPASAAEVAEGPPPPSTAFAHFPPPLATAVLPHAAVPPDAAAPLDAVAPLDAAALREGAHSGGAPASVRAAGTAASTSGAATSKVAEVTNGAAATNGVMPQGRSVVQFPAHIREQAEGWLRSGSLSLPNCSSPRHARAMQRALLLALLDRPGYERLPLGLKQRVGWLLSPGWERQTTGSVASEASDLMTVLCVASGPGSLQSLMSALRQLIPNPLPLVRPPSSYPPARR